MSGEARVKVYYSYVLTPPKSGKEHTEYKLLVRKELVDQLTGHKVEFEVEKVTNSVQEIMDIFERSKFDEKEMFDELFIKEE